MDTEKRNIIIKACASKNGKINTHCASDNWMSKHPDICVLLHELLPKISNIGELLYMVFYNIDERPKCKYCRKELSYIPGIGYRDFCSVSCSKLYKKSSKDINDKDVILNDLIVDGKINYNKIKEKYLIEHGYMNFINSIYNENMPYIEKIYCLYNGIDKNNIPDKKFISFEQGYGIFDSKDINEDFIIKQYNSNDLLGKKVSYLKRNHIYDYVINYYNDSNDYYENLYRIVNHIDYKPKCPVCGKPLEYSKFIKGYKKFCSLNCYNKQLRYDALIKLKEHTGFNITLDNNNNFIFHNVCYKHPEFTLSPLLVHNRCYGGRYKGIICPICNPPIYSKDTSIEIIIENILVDLNISFEKHVRNIISPKELDFYIPNFNIAIECNGMYWHSDEKKNKNYHIDKIRLCNEKGIRLIILWEDDILFNADKIKSILNNIFGKNSHKIYARKCQVQLIDSDTSREFLRKYHLQGSVNSSIKLGLFYNNELVEVMTFGKLRKTLNSEAKDGYYELYRLCTKTDFTVIGGASKLLKYFEQHYSWKAIISYAKCDISQGNIYEVLNFSEKTYTGPGFFYYDLKNNKRIHRFSLRKSIVYDGSNRTTDDIIKLDYGYIKCWDSGNYKYIKYNWDK